MNRFSEVEWQWHGPPDPGFFQIAMLGIHLPLLDVETEGQERSIGCPDSKPFPQGHLDDNCPHIQEGLDTAIGPCQSCNDRWFRGSNKRKSKRMKPRP